MNKKKKIIIIGGTIFAAVVITVISFSNNKADKNLQKEMDSTYATENSVLVDETIGTTDVTVDEDTITMAIADAMASTEAVSYVETWEVTDEIVTEIEGVVTKYYSTEEFSEDVLVTDTTKVQEKVKEKIVEKRDGIEAYKDIKVIVRKGLEKDTYVAFATYKTKFFNIDTLAPGMSVLYIVPNEEGKLGIQDTPDDEKLGDYIDALLKEEEITSLVKAVNKGFAEAIEKDDNLKTFVEKLTDKTE